MTQAQMQRMDRIFDAIFKERERQEELKAAGRFKFTCADPEGLSSSEKLTVLGEEFGEVARLVKQNINGLIDAPVMNRELKIELLQVAAVCVGWVESLNKEGVE